MKIAVCSQGDKAESTVDSRLGRAAYFGIYDDQTEEWQFLSNSQNLQAAQGAGIQAARHIIDADADVVLACNVGPKAMTALLASGIKVYKASAGISLQETVQEFTAGKLNEIDQANVEGHWA